MRDRSKINPKVSVVIPMYNCEQFVPDLLKMFSEQSFTDFEVVCVIDGATDGTEDAVKEYCKTDDRFRYVVRENGGAGAARNTGLENARGKYIIFPDADDTYSKDYLFKLYNAAEAQRSEIAICDTTTFDYLAGEKREIGTFNKTKLIEGEVYSSKRIKGIFRMIGTHVSNKLFLLDFINTENLRFSEVPASNDIFFSKASITCAERIAFVHDNLITIRRHINPKSISSNRGKYSHIALSEVQKIYKWFEERGLLSTFISDYQWLFDVTANYEMKNSDNHLFVEEMARILNCEEPWKKLNSSQITNLLKRCLGKEGGEEIKKPEKDATSEDLERLKRRNKISSERNDNKQHMQEMVKKTSLEKYSRDLDDPESVSLYHKINSISDHSSHVENTHIEHQEISSKEPEISVIIPMFNCEDFVYEVLSMFSDQSFMDFEVICVIDGATDRTEELVKEYCSKDRRFSYIYKANGGAGSARNAGMDMARGKYIVFCDGDDEYNKDYLLKLYESAVIYDAQIVISRFLATDYSLHRESIQGFETAKFCEGIVYSNKDIDCLFASFNPRICNKLFNTAFVRSSGLRFSETRISNDTFFVYAGLSIADRIIVVYDILSNYRICINNESITSVKRRTHIHEAIETLRELYQWLKDHSLLDIYSDEYKKRTNRVLLYNGAFGVTPRFISEFAHMINEEEPWKNMSTSEILVFLKTGLFPENYIETEEDNNSDVNIRMFLNTAQQCENMVHTAELIRQVSKERYGREFFNDND